MVEKALSLVFFGMIQSKEVDGEVFEVGCLGKINRNKKLRWKNFNKPFTNTF